GVFRSTDGGDSWTHLGNGLYDPDGHDMTIVGARPKRLFVNTARDIFLSDVWATRGTPWGSRRSGPSPMPAALQSSPTTLACCMPDVGRQRPVSKDMCCAPQI